MRVSVLVSVCAFTCKLYGYTYVHISVEVSYVY